MISSVRFLDEETVLSSDCDGMVKVWSLANCSRPISTITCEAGVSCLEIGEEDQKVYAGLLNGGILYADYGKIDKIYITYAQNLTFCTLFITVWLTV